MARSLPAKFINQILVLFLYLIKRYVIHECFKCTRSNDIIDEIYHGNAIFINV